MTHGNADAAILNASRPAPAGETEKMPSGAAHSAGIALSAHDRKRWATAQAQLALVGFKADKIEGDDGQPLYVVSRWSLTRSFVELSELESFAARIKRGV